MACVIILDEHKIFLSKIEFPQSCRLGKKQSLWTPWSSIFFSSAKLVNFSVNFGSLNMRIRNSNKNVNFIACKWCKICKYYLYSMVISLLQEEDNKRIWVKYLICAVLLQFQICRHLHVFSTKSVFPKFQSSHWVHIVNHKKNVFLKSAVMLRLQLNFIADCKFKCT